MIIEGIEVNVVDEVDETCRGCFFNRPKYKGDDTYCSVRFSEDMEEELKCSHNVIYQISLSTVLKEL